MRIGRPAIAILTCAALAACSLSPPSASSPPTPESAEQINEQAGTDLAPDAVDKAVATLDGTVDRLMKDSGVPGMAVAVVEGDTVPYMKGFGSADVAAGRKVDPDTVFPLASLSKPIGASVVAHQVGVGAAAWDMPIASALPGFALSDPYVTATVTVGDMYSHRSGLPEHAGDKLEDLGYTQQEIFARLREVPLGPFRTRHEYTNYGLTAAGEAVAAKAGTDWATLSANALYAPLGMSSTSSRYSDFMARTNRASAYVRDESGTWIPSPIARSYEDQAPAGGVTSSVRDLSTWLKMLLADGKHNGAQVIDADALLAAHSPQIVSSPPAASADRAGFYGYGFDTSVTSDGRVRYSHSGAFSSGAATTFVVLPSANVAIVAIANGSPIGVPEALAAEFIDQVQYGKVTQDWAGIYRNAFEAYGKPFGSLVGQAKPANPAPPAPLASYVGTYENPFYGPVTVSENGGALTLAMGPGGTVTHPLTSWDGNTFTFPMRAESAEAGSISKATFDGPALTIEYYQDEESNGVFTRR